MVVIVVVVSLSICNTCSDCGYIVNHCVAFGDIVVINNVVDQYTLYNSLVHGLNPTVGR